MADSRLQTIAYPSPSSRPFRRHLDPLAPHVIVLFGATGDLSKRKLLPGLAYLAESALAPDIRVVGTAMEDISSGEFRTLFTTAEGIESLWERSVPLLEDPPPIKVYGPGTWGHNSIHQLIAPNAWRLPFERAWRTKIG